MKIIVAFLLFAFSFSETVIAHNIWPRGQYCLPMPPNQGCPFGWAKGTRFHDSEDYSGSGHYNQRHGHYPHLTSFGRNLGWGFCCKTHNTLVQKSWPKGSYCIFRKGGSCPRSFDQGSIFWDDEDVDNGNTYSGSVPDGHYDRNTRIYFCCRNDGSGRLKNLPTVQTFMLMRYKGSCPSVSGYRGPYTGFLDWDTEDTRNVDEKLGAHPDGVTKFGSGIKIEFCTYKH